MNDVSLITIIIIRQIQFQSHVIVDIFGWHKIILMRWGVPSVSIQFLCFCSQSIKRIKGSHVKNILFCKIYLTMLFFCTHVQKILILIKKNIQKGTFLSSACLIWKNDFVLMWKLLREGSVNQQASLQTKI